MKALKVVLIFGLLFSIINCTCSSTYNIDEDDLDFNYEDKSASSGKCSKRAFNSDEIEDDAYKCCYFDYSCKEEGLSISFKGCDYLDKDDYEHLSDYIKELEDYCSKYKVDCSGSTLEKLLFSSFVLLFFL